NGCEVCTEAIDRGVYPCYWFNHPTCLPNYTCGGQQFSCSAGCPAPVAADMGACGACGGSASGWVGCRGNGCAVCGDATPNPGALPQAGEGLASEVDDDHVIAQHVGAEPRDLVLFELFAQVGEQLARLLSPPVGVGQPLREVFGEAEHAAALLVHLGGAHRPP